MLTDKETSTEEKLIRINEPNLTRVSVDEDKEAVQEFAIKPKAEPVMDEAVIETAKVEEILPIPQTAEDLVREERAESQEQSSGGIFSFIGSFFLTEKDVQSLQSPAKK